jgi:hypothetical protein
LRPAEWRPVRRIRPQFRLKAVTCEDGHRGAHQFGRTLRTNSPWITKTLRTNPPWFGKNTTNEPTVVRQKHYERTHRRRSTPGENAKNERPNDGRRRKCAEQTHRGLWKRYERAPVSRGKNMTNEHTGVRGNVTNEPTAGREKTTNEPTEVRAIATNELKPVRENATNEPTGVLENAPNEPTSRSAEMRKRAKRIVPLSET